MAKIKCLQCGDTIESSGKWVSCTCGKCYIDGNEYYCRYGGDFDKYEVETGDGWMLAKDYISLNIETEGNDESARDNK